jgi:hypothetical protein
MIRPILEDQDGTCLIGVQVRAETLTDGAADWLAGGGELTSDSPVCGGQGRELDEERAEVAAWAMVGMTACVLGVTLGILSLYVWPVR